MTATLPLPQSGFSVCAWVDLYTSFLCFNEPFRPSILHLTKNPNLTVHTTEDCSWGLGAVYHYRRAPFDVQECAEMDGAVFTSEPMSPPMTPLALTGNAHTICSLYINPLRVAWWYCYKRGIYQTFIMISVNGWACLGALLSRCGTLRERPAHFPLQWKGIETFWLHCDLK